MADYFDSAATKNDSTKAALLQAIATQGSQAKQAFDAAQAQIATQKQAAVQAALAEATQRGAPTAVTGQVSDTIGQGYDRRSADLGAAQASRASSLGNISAAAGTYMDEANAALPVLRTRQQMNAATNQTSMANQLAQLRAQQDAQSQTAQRELTMFEGTLADRKAQRDYEAQQAELKRQSDATQATQQQRLQELQLAIAQANLGKAETSAAPKAATATNPLTDIGGMAGLQAVLDGVNSQVGPDGGRKLLNPALNNHQVYDRPRSTASVVADATGLPPALVQGVAAQQATKAATATQAQFNKDNPDVVSLGKAISLSVPETQKMLASKEYRAAQQLAEVYASQGRSLEDLKAALGSATELQNKPKTRDAILKMYGGQLVSTSYANAHIA